MTVSEKLMPGCPLDTETLSECLCSECLETNSCRREWVQPRSPHPLLPGNEPGNESEPFKSRLSELLNLAIDAVAPTPNFSIMLLLLSLQRIEQQSIYFQGAKKIRIHI